MKVAITGVTGYLGSRLAAALRTDGHEPVALSRRAPAAPMEWRPYDLAGSPRPTILHGVDALVHAAYDLTVTRWPDIQRINISGTLRLLDVAAQADMPTVYVSSMSAYPGTEQLYGRVKLICEAATLERCGVVVRPGLVYGPQAQGMVGALRKAATTLPVLPTLRAAHQFTVHEDDFVDGLVRLVSQRPGALGPVGLAHPEAVSFGQILSVLAQDRNPRLIAVPWRPLYAAMRTAEALHLRLPLRADSLLGLVRPAPSVPGVELWERLGVQLRPFPVALGG